MLGRRLKPSLPPQVSASPEKNVSEGVAAAAVGLDSAGKLPTEVAAQGAGARGDCHDSKLVPNTSPGALLPVIRFHTVEPEPSRGVVAAVT